jgi:GNAT superfamily N-acetyltransferase
MDYQTLKFTLAGPSDAPAVAALRSAAARDLTERHGQGHWSHEATERGVLNDFRHAEVWVVRDGADILGTFRLATKKPWAIDTTYFTDCKRPFYLTNMAVHPEMQRQGIGRRCLEHAVERVRRWPGDAIRLDAYDADAGAGHFYARCGFREVGRVVYRTNPLIYYELVLA